MARSKNFRFLVLLALLFVFGPLRADATRDVASACRNDVDKVIDKIGGLAAKKHITNILWNFWQCLGDTEIKKDAYAICDIVGNIVNDISHFHMARNFFVEKQMRTLSGLCDTAASQLQGVSDGDVKVALELIESQISDPKLAKAVHEHGHELALKVVEGLYPHETCSYINNQWEIAASTEGPAGKIKDFRKQILRNMTHCLECNVCQSVMLLATVEILPNSNLPTCIVQVVKENICVLLNQTLPGIGNEGYDLCVQVITDFKYDIVNALKTFLHPNLVCGTLLKACTHDYHDNLLECVCDNVKLPKGIEPLMPCQWQKAIP